MKKIRLEKHIKIKLIISIILIGLLVLSFFFAKPLEDILGLSGSKRKNQTSSETVVSSSYFVSYLDVGQGNSVLIKLPDGKTILVDGGDISYGEVVAKYLTDYGVGKIDYLIATHSDSDHIGGLNYVLDKFEVKNILRPFQISGSGTSAETFIAYEYEDINEIYEKLMLDTSGKNKVSRVTTSVYKDFIRKIYSETYFEENTEVESRVGVFYDGLKISGDNYEIEFFAPLKRETEYNLEDYCDKTTGYATVGYGVANTNDNSAIFTLNCFGDYYLFTGDASFNGEGKGTNKAEDDFIESLTNEEIQRLSNISVYLLGHHGSKHSSSRELLSLINPRFIVVSSGHEYGHPADETLARLLEIKSLEPDYLLRTDEFGTIEFSKVDDGLKYSLEKAEADEDIKISYFELSSIITVVLIVLIFALKPARAKA